jgi:hypothetical protein
MMEAIALDVPTPFAPYVPAALARLGYLHPGVAWSFDSAGSRLEARCAPGSHTAEELKREAFFQLYREKVYQDTLSVRSRIYEASSP